MQKSEIRSLSLSTRALVILISGALPASAAELRWKPKPGEALHYVLEQNTVIRLKHGSTEAGTITRTFTVDLTRTVKSVADDGTADMTQRFDRVRMTYAGGIFKIEYDSAKEPDPAVAPLVASLKAMVGAEFSFKMSSRGEMSDVRIPDAVAKAFREAGARGASADQFSEEGFKRSLIDTSVTFPAEDLSQGKSWSRQLKVQPPGGGQIVHTRTYTYDGPDAQFGPGVEKIGVSSKLERSGEKASASGEELKSQESTGSLYFDNAKGHMVSSTVTEKTESSLMIKDTSIDQFIEQHTTMKLTPEAAK